ncbi:hypothetical protein [Prauserella halophila]|uniref:hypothetical protein n=1 Tax=Prauserella halophila TaxID=185641 RepID=UPI0020A3479C|nr:hypothetical protein [Prauserella halophila]
MDVVEVDVEVQVEPSGDEPVGRAGPVKVVSRLVDVMSTFGVFRRVPSVAQSPDCVIDISTVCLIK